MSGTIERNSSNIHNADTGVLTGYRNPVTGREETLALSVASEAPVAILGDSTFVQGFSSTGGADNSFAGGSFNWAFAYLGYPWDFQVSDIFAVGGAVTAGVVSAQIPAMLSAHASRRYCRALISVGVNDTQGSVAVATTKTNFLSIFSLLRNAGVVPAVVSIRPRSFPDATWTVPKQNNAELNQWLAEQSRLGLIEFIPVAEEYADNADALGNPLASFTEDGLHPSPLGAAFEGKAIADYYISRGVMPAMVFAEMQADVFDRTNNPSGVCFLAANPLLQGGTTTPTGMSTSGGTWSLGSRTLRNGQTRAVRSCALAASTTHYLYDDWNKTGAWTASDLQPGDYIELRAKVVLTSAVNITSLYLRLAEYDGATYITNYGLYHGSASVLTGSHTLYLKTFKKVIRSYAGSGDASFFGRLDCVTGSGASGTLAVHAFEVRKV